MSDKLTDSELLQKIIGVKVKGPKQLKQCGTGALLNEQQYCYEKGYKDGVAVLRKAQRALLDN